MGEIGENSIGEVEVGLEPLIIDNINTAGDTFNKVNIPRYSDEIRIFASIQESPTFPDDFDLSDTVTETQTDFEPSLAIGRQFVTYRFEATHRLGYTVSTRIEKLILQGNSSVINPNSNAGNSVINLDLEPARLGLI